LLEGVQIIVVVSLVTVSIARLMAGEDKWRRIFDAGILATAVSSYLTFSYSKLLTLTDLIMFCRARFISPCRACSDFSTSGFIESFVSSKLHSPLVSQSSPSSARCVTSVARRQYRAKSDPCPDSSQLFPFVFVKHPSVSIFARLGFTQAALAIVLSTLLLLTPPRFCPKLKEVSFDSTLTHLFDP